MAKFGPFSRSDSYPGVRGVLERLMTHFLVWSLVLHVCPELEDEWLGTSVGAVGAESILDDGAEAMDVAEAVELPLTLDEVIEFLDGTFECPLKERLWSMLSMF